MCHPEVPPGTPLPDVRTQEVGIPVGGETMPGLVALPPKVPAPGVLIVNDVFGRSAFYEHLARRIAQAGFVALDVEYFFRQGPVPAGDRAAAMERAARLDQRKTLDDLDRALAWLADSGDTAGPRAGVIGFCMGGTLALDMAAGRGDLAAVSYYGFPARRGESPLAPPVPLEIADEMRGPILGHWGTADEGVGIENVRELDRRLSSARVEHTFHLYEGLPHGFLKALLDTTDAPGHDAACESWKRTLAFWHRYLGAARDRSEPSGIGMDEM